MNSLGIILARGGSAGLSNKHLRPLLGRCVLDYTLDHAAAASRLTRTIVTSDCPEILARAAKRGFATLARPSNLATADASVQDTLLHALDHVQKLGAFRADAVVTLYGNVPLRPAGLIDRAIEKLEATRCDSVRSFVSVGKWHPAWMSRFDGDRVVALHKGSIHRRQDLEPLFLHEGGVVVSTAAALLRGRETPHDPHTFFGIDRRGIETQSGEVIEVDTLRDLYWAEAALREQRAFSNTTFSPEAA